MFSLYVQGIETEYRIKVEQLQLMKDFKWEQDQNQIIERLESVCPGSNFKKA